MKKQNPLYDSKIYYEQREKFEKSFLGKLSLKSRKKLYPILRTVIKIQNKLNGYKIKCIGNRSTPSDLPKIYAITHIGKLDIETVATYINEHFILLSGDFENLYGTVAGTFLMLNGCIFLRKDDPNDRHLSKEKIVQTLREGGNIMWFPEGAWNLSANLPVLRMPYGIVDAAQQANAVIIPIAIEQYEKNFIVNIGENYYVGKDNNLIDEISRLRDVMATLKYEIWQSVPQMLSSEVPSYTEMEAAFLDKRFSEWTLPRETVFSWIFKPKNIITSDEAFAHLSDLQINRSNAFLLNKRLK